MTQKQKSNNTVFYHGTSTFYNATDYISPTTKINKTKLTFRPYKFKIHVTSDIEAAKFYAEKDVEKVGGEPVIYVVTPDRYSLVRISKTEYLTTKAKIESIYQENDEGTVSD